MTYVGRAIRQIRESRGLTQRAAAEALGISSVHLCNVENEKSTPSDELVDRIRDIWRVDPYVLAWCLYGAVEKLPKRLQEPTRRLASAWREELGLCNNASER